MRSPTRVFIPLLLATIGACTPSAPPAAVPPSAAPAPIASPADARRTAALDLRPGDVRLAPDVSVRRLGPGLWLHTTLGDDDIPSNGVLLETPDARSVLFDPGWNDEHAAVLVRWAEESLRRPVARAVFTHSHYDRTGGRRALHARGIAASALALTGELLRRRGPADAPLPDSVPGLTAGPVRDPAGFELLYPGAGHAPDNIVVYFPAQRVLLGGCLVKSDTATQMGNVADADIGHWPRAVARVRAAYPAVHTVIPGHGAVGGAAALRWTERLVNEKGAAAKAGAR